MKTRTHVFLTLIRNTEQTTDYKHIKRISFMTAFIDGDLICSHAIR